MRIPQTLSHFSKHFRLAFFPLFIGAGLMLSSCGDKREQTSFNKVTDIVHTPVKRQSIGNCWLYAFATWTESQLKSYNNEDIDVSESYWSWWHWYYQLATAEEFKKDGLNTGGNWYVARSIMLQHGWVAEKDFIPEEEGQPLSLRQSLALSYINKQIADGGSLHTKDQRTPRRIIRELNKAFGVEMEKVISEARSAKETKVKVRWDGTEATTIADLLSSDGNQRWTAIDVDETNRRDQLKRVFRALNDYQPVVMSVFIDFNAQDQTDNGAFKRSILDQAGAPGSQGGHMVVLEDYIVKMPDGSLSKRGDLTKEEKLAAIEGELVALVVKNSWGTNRPDRGMIDGYTTFYADYLFTKLKLKEDSDEPSEDGFVVPLDTFYLPAGY
jgi:hypothetical protein